jgi:RNA polymerase sigma factor (sigma-70 family)
VNSNKESKFLDLVKKHKGILYKISRMYADEPGDREDLQQEIMIQLWKSFENFSEESAFSTWMYRVAVNTSITFLKKEKRRLDTVSFEMAGDTHYEEYTGRKDEQLEIFYKASQQLNPIEKALMFYYMEGLSHRETGVQLGISEVNVRVKLNRIKEKLQDIIKKKQNEL